MFADPDFVSSYDVDDYVYFFFRETAIEYINCGKVRHCPVVYILRAAINQCTVLAVLLT